MKANVYTIIEDKESGTFEAFISGPWDENVEMVPEVEAEHLDEPYVCYRKHDVLDNVEVFPNLLIFGETFKRVGFKCRYWERFPAEGKIKYIRDETDGVICHASFWLSSKNQSQDTINEIRHQYYADVVSEACEQRDYYTDRIKKLNAMWKATVHKNDKR